MKRSVTILFVLMLLSSLPSGVSAQSASDQRIAVPLTDPSRPVRLEVDLFSGQIEIEGYDGREVVIVARNETATQVEPGDTGGMKRIPNTALGLTVEEQQNAVRVSGDWRNRTVSVLIRVPTRTSASVTSVTGGNIVVRGLTGELELQNTNGGIEATGIRGSAVAHSTNGSVEVSFVEVTPDKPMSFSTLNGNVDVSFPAGTKADLRIEPGRGEILTDFDFELVPTAPTVEQSERGGGYRVDVGQDVRARIGGGGPTYHFKTFNGTIYVRKSR